LAKRKCGAAGKMTKKGPLSDYPFAIGIPAVIWQILFFYLPLAILSVSSFVAFGEEGTFTGFTWEKVSFFFRIPYLKVILCSLLLAFSNALICLLIAYPLAYYLAFSNKKGKNLLLFLLIVPFWTNFLLHVYAWFFVLEKQGFLNLSLQWLGITNGPIHFLNSIFAIMIMMVYYYLPFMVLPIYAALEKFDTKLIEASFDLGATWGQTLRKILLPLSSRSIKTGFFLVYIPSFGEFAIPELMGGDRRMFVGTVVSHYILGDTTGSLGAAFTLLSCIVLIASAIFLYGVIDYFLRSRRT
jgi:spermidine/putrescine transport system permease protein